MLGSILWDIPIYGNDQMFQKQGPSVAPNVGVTKQGFMQAII